MKNGLIEARFLFAPSGFARCEAVLFDFMPWSSCHSERLVVVSPKQPRVSGRWGAVSPGTVDVPGEKPRADPSHRPGKRSNLSQLDAGERWRPVPADARRGDDRARLCVVHYRNARIQSGVRRSACASVAERPRQRLQPQDSGFVTQVKAFGSYTLPKIDLQTSANIQA